MWQICNIVIRLGKIDLYLAGSDSVIRNPDRSNVSEPYLRLGSHSGKGLQVLLVVLLGRVNGLNPLVSLLDRVCHGREASCTADHAELPGILLGVGDLQGQLVEVEAVCNF